MTTLRDYKMVKYLLALILLLCSITSSYGQLLSKGEIDTYKSYFPKFQDQDFQKMLESDKTIWYNDVVMPRAYAQLSSDQPYGQLTYFRADYNISGDAREAAKGHGNGGNANIEFPWKKNAGSDESTKTIKFIHLPDSKPIVYYENILYRELWPSPGQRLPLKGISWAFPVGTVFCEALATTGSKGTYIYEVRTRTRGQEYWEVEIYRPYSTIESLIRLVQKYEPDSNLPDKIKANLQKVTKERFTDTEHPTNRGVDVTGYLYTLPEFPEELTHNILTKTEFVNCGGVEFYSDENIKIFAPSSNANFGIVPKNYKGNFAGNDSTSCNNCHKHTEKSCTFFDVRRDWYGHVSGSDRIISFHIIEPSALSNNGGPGRNVLRKAFIENGLLEKYDKSKHDREYYHILPEE